MRKKDSLEPEVICSQPGVVNLQDDPVVVGGGFQDLQTTERELSGTVLREQNSMPQLCLSKEDQLCEVERQGQHPLLSLECRPPSGQSGKGQ